MRVLPFLLLVGLALTPHASSATPGVAFAAAAVGRPTASAVVPFLVHLPLRNSAELESLVALQGTPGTLAYHHWLTPAQFRARYGPAPATVAAALTALRRAGISVDRVSSQFISAHASAGLVARTFGADLRTFRGPSGKLHLGSRTGLTLPPELSRLGADVEGIVYHGEGRPNVRIKPLSAQAASLLTSGSPLNRTGTGGPLWFDDAKQAYRDPDNRVANGTGVQIATVNESDYSGADLRMYWSHELLGWTKGNLAGSATVLHALVPGAPHFSPDNNGASVEADVDTQTVSSTAPGATLTAWTTNGFDFPADFLQVYDYINEENSEDIVSTSYGECELFFKPEYNGGQNFEGILFALHDTFLQGNSEGITYTVSSGDSAGRACPSLAYLENAGSGNTYETVGSVSIPASDPNVVAVGGGNLLTGTSAKSLASPYSSENAYADPEPVSDAYGIGDFLEYQFFGAGGGQSQVFAKPYWQAKITPGTSRSVPDVGAFVGGCFADAAIFVLPCATTVSNWVIVYAGSFSIASGTSIAAPETAATFALLEDAAGSRTVPGAGRFGNINPFLYSLPATTFHKNIAGYNGVVHFAAGAAWNPSYGLGSLFNTPLITPLAGIPQTLSNP